MIVQGEKKNVVQLSYSKVEIWLRNIRNKVAEWWKKPQHIPSQTPQTNIKQFRNLSSRQQEVISISTLVRSLAWKPLKNYWWLPCLLPVSGEKSQNQALLPHSLEILKKDFLAWYPACEGPGLFKPTLTDTMKETLWTGPATTIG